MAGGDGSQALVATVAARRDVAHVCIPAGTRNHFALDLGLDRDDVVGALDAFTDGVERRIDLARVNDRVFVNNASLGVYAKVVQSERLPRRQARTWTRDAARPARPGRRADRPRVHRRRRGQSCGDAAARAGLEQPLRAHPPVRRRHARAHRQRACSASSPRGCAARRRCRSSSALELVGQAGRFPGLLAWSAGEFEVRSGGPVEVGLDGEALVLDPPLRFVSLPGALRVRAPAQRRPVAGRARGARSRARTSARCVRVAAGR